MTTEEHKYYERTRLDKIQRIIKKSLIVIWLLTALSLIVMGVVWQHPADELAAFCLLYLPRFLDITFY